MNDSEDRLYQMLNSISSGDEVSNADLLKYQIETAEHGLLVLMANHGGPSGGWACAGRSAIWAADGSLLAAVPGVGDALLIARRAGRGWASRVMAL